MNIDYTSKNWQEIITEFSTYETDDMAKLIHFLDEYKDYKIHQSSLSTTYNSKEDSIIYTLIINFEK